jgi:hypothetical protein
LVPAHPLDARSQLLGKGLHQSATEPGIKGARCVPNAIVGYRKAKFSGFALEGD